MRPSLRFFIFLTLLAACAPIRQYSNVREVKPETLSLSARFTMIKNNKSHYDLRINAKEGDKPTRQVLAVICRKEFELRDGSRFRCQSPNANDMIEVVYQSKKKIGAVILESKQVASGKRQFLSCAEAAPEPLRLNCFSGKSSRGAREGFVAPIPSSLRGVNLPNTHVVWSSPDGGSRLIRAMTPSLEEDFRQLVDEVKIDEVLIFKNLAPNEGKIDDPGKMNDIDQEIFKFKAKGMDVTSIHHIPFKYFDFADFLEPCTQTLEALAVLTAAAASSKQIFFHCTVGEDRTGYLAGLFRLLHERVSIQKVFIEEMCERGYGAGDPQKPFNPVVKDVHEDLTPTFLKIAYLIKEGRISAIHPDESVGSCNQDPIIEEKFAKIQADYKADKYFCKTSTHFYP